jgi:hypothetical protein
VAAARMGIMSKELSSSREQYSAISKGLYARGRARPAAGLGLHIMLRVSSQATSLGLTRSMLLCAQSPTLHRMQYNMLRKRKQNSAQPSQKVSMVVKLQGYASDTNNFIYGDAGVPRQLWHVASVADGLAQPQRAIKLG